MRSRIWRLRVSSAEGKPEVVTESAKKYLAIVKEYRASKKFS